MTFESAFCLPRWWRDLKLTADQLIAYCQAQEGAVGKQVNAGAHALAKWILANPTRAEAEAAAARSPLYMGGVIRRILAGVVLPSPDLAEAIARMTDNAATFDAFDQAAIAVQALDPVEADAVRALIFSAPRETPATADLEEPRGRLGETPPGPLFTVKRRRDWIEIDGLGVTLRPSICAAELLRDQLTNIL